MSDYTVCPKCQVRHSVLVKHRCFKPAEQKEKPEIDRTNETGDPDKGEKHGDQEGNEGKGKGEGEGRDGEGEGQGQGEGEGEGEGEAKGDPKGEGGQGGQGGQGEGEEGEGKDGGDGDGDGEYVQTEEEAPPMAVLITVMKYGAIKAAECDNPITINLTPEGLDVYGVNGDAYVQRLIPWGELEKRATTDGQAYVADTIREVDQKLTEAEPDDWAERSEQEDGWIEWKGGKNPVPGKRVEVRFRGEDVPHDVGHPSETWYWEHGDSTADIVAYKVVADAEEEAPKPKPIDFDQPIKFVGGKVAKAAHVWDRDRRVVGVLPGESTFQEYLRKQPKGLAITDYRHSFNVTVDEFGFHNGCPFITN